MFSTLNFLLDINIMKVVILLKKRNVPSSLGSCTCWIGGASVMRTCKIASCSSRNLLSTTGIEKTGLATVVP